MADDGPEAWYRSLPIITRGYMTASFAATVVAQLELVSPMLLYLDFGLVLGKLELWRLLTNLCFFGTFSLPFVFSMFFLVRYSGSRTGAASPCDPVTHRRPTLYAAWQVRYGKELEQKYAPTRLEPAASGCRASAARLRRSPPSSACPPRGRWLASRLAGGSRGDRPTSCGASPSAASS